VRKEKKGGEGGKKKRGGGGGGGGGGEGGGGGGGSAGWARGQGREEVDMSEEEARRLEPAARRKSGARWTRPGRSPRNAKAQTKIPPREKDLQSREGASRAGTICSPFF